MDSSIILEQSIATSTAPNNSNSPPQPRTVCAHAPVHETLFNAGVASVKRQRNVSEAATTEKPSSCPSSNSHSRHLMRARLVSGSQQFWAEHGDEDRVIPTSSLKDLVQELNLGSTPLADALTAALDPHGSGGVDFSTFLEFINVFTQSTSRPPAPAPRDRSVSVTAPPRERAGSVIALSELLPAGAASEYSRQIDERISLWVSSQAQIDEFSIVENSEIEFNAGLEPEIDVSHEIPPFRDLSFVSEVDVDVHEPALSDLYDTQGGNSGTPRSILSDTDVINERELRRAVAIARRSVVDRLCTVRAPAPAPAPAPASPVIAARSRALAGRSEGRSAKSVVPEECVMDRINSMVEGYVKLGKERENAKASLDEAELAECTFAPLTRTVLEETRVGNSYSETRRVVDAVDAVADAEVAKRLHARTKASRSLNEHISDLTRIPKHRLQPAEPASAAPVPAPAVSSPALPATRTLVKPMPPSPQLATAATMTQRRVAQTNSYRAIAQSTRRMGETRSISAEKTVRATAIGGAGSESAYAVRAAPPVIINDDLDLYPAGYEATVRRVRSAAAAARATKAPPASTAGSSQLLASGSTAPRPFSFMTDSRHEKRRNAVPLFYLDVNVGNGRTGRMVIHRGDDPQAQVNRFASIHRLGSEAKNRLLQMVVEQMRAWAVELGENTEDWVPLPIEQVVKEELEETVEVLENIPKPPSRPPPPPPMMAPPTAPPPPPMPNFGPEWGTNTLCGLRI